VFGCERDLIEGEGSSLGEWPKNSPARRSGSPFGIGTQSMRNHIAKEIRRVVLINSTDHVFLVVIRSRESHNLSIHIFRDGMVDCSTRKNIHIESPSPTIFPIGMYSRIRSKDEQHDGQMQLLASPQKWNENSCCRTINVATHNDYNIDTFKHNHQIMSWWSIKSQKKCI
jgi:hypothetical protein